MGKPRHERQQLVSTDTRSTQDRGWQTTQALAHPLKHLK
ncbi:hypothetical protein QF036_002508 [Arthrobacter globiformis]|nr:hypothetical protein [Arthrobacter globiformis]